MRSEAGDGAAAALTASGAIRLWDYLFVLRPVLLVPGWTTMCAGYLAANAPVDDLSGLFWAAVAFGGVMGATFIFNQLADIGSDRVNQKVYPISSGDITLGKFRAEAMILLILGMAIGVARGPWMAGTLATFALITGYLYNYRPFNWRNRPLLGMFANAAMGVLAFALGWLVATAGASAGFGAAVLPYLLFNAAAYLNTTIPDLRGDSEADKTTFAVRHGPKVTAVVSSLLHLGALAAAIQLGDFVIMIPILLVIPLYIRLVLRADAASAIYAVKGALFTFAVVIAFILPLFALVIAAVYFGTRIYYLRRFRIAYPSFSG